MSCIQIQVFNAANIFGMIFCWVNHVKLHFSSFYGGVNAKSSGLGEDSSYDIW